MTSPPIPDRILRAVIDLQDACAESMCRLGPVRLWVGARESDCEMEVISPSGKVSIVLTKDLP